jgi:excisionase family DNA binding protein
MPVLLNAQEVSNELRISKSKAYDLMASGQLPCVSIGRSRRVKREDLEWLVKMGQKGSRR